MKAFIIILGSLLFLLSGCNGAGVHFSNIVKGDVSKITADTSSGIYATTDEEVIDLFLNKMESMTLNETVEGGSVYKRAFELYDDNGKKLATIVLKGKNIVSINGNDYKFDEYKLKAFTDVFLTEKNLVAGNDEVVVLNVGTKNLELLNAFLKNVKRENKDYVRIIRYTIEGAPIIRELKFDGERIKYTIDTTKDEYGFQEIRTTTCKQINKKVQKKEMIYFVERCKGNENQVVLSVPLISKNDALAIAKEKMRSENVQWKITFQENARILGDKKVPAWEIKAIRQNGQTIIYVDPVSGEIIKILEKDKIKGDN